MGKTIRSANLRRAHKNMKDVYKNNHSKNTNLTVDEYLLRLRVQNLNSGDSEW